MVRQFYLQRADKNPRCYERRSLMRTALGVVLCVLSLTFSDALAQIPSPWSAGWWVWQPCLMSPEFTWASFPADNACEMVPGYASSEPDGWSIQYRYVHFGVSGPTSLVVHVPQDVVSQHGIPFVLLRGECSCIQFLKLTNDGTAADVSLWGYFNTSARALGATIRWLGVKIDGAHYTALYSQDGAAWQILAEGILPCSENLLLGFGVEGAVQSEPVVFRDIAIGSELVAMEATAWGAVKARYR